MAFDFGLIPIALAAAIVAPAGSLPNSAPALSAFGIAQDARPSALGCSPIDGSGPDETGQYVCTSVPHENTLFQQYIVAYVKGVGVCNVSAVSAYIVNDHEGKKTREVFGKAYDMMSGQLGPADQTVDHVTSSKFRDTRRFESAVISEDRQIFDQWNDLSLRFSNGESASLAISGSEDLGLAVYGIFRFAGNDDCLHKLELATGRSASE